MPNVERNLLISIVVAIVIFLIIREILCWYWKINARLAQLEKLNEKMDALLMRLQEISMNLAARPAVPPPPPPPVTPQNDAARPQ
jgi:hypothetical protein